MNQEKVTALKKAIFKDVNSSDIIPETKHRTNGDAVDVLLVKSDKLISEYQGRIYVPKKEDAFDGNGDLRIDRMLEFISEPYREYMEAPESFKSKYPAFYELMKETLEDE